LYSGGPPAADNPFRKGSSDREGTREPPALLPASRVPGSPPCHDGWHGRCLEFSEWWGEDSSPDDCFHRL